jgi:hypothetical protein
MNPNPIQYQAIELWQTLSDKDTKLTFKQGAIALWKVLKQAGRLVFLVGLFFVVVVVWFWSVAYRAGSDFRYWLETAMVSPEQLVAKTVEIITAPIKWFVKWSEVKLQELLGIEKSTAITGKTEPKLIAGKTDTNVAIDAIPSSMVAKGIAEILDSQTPASKK